jgi:hypothetical protein
MKRLSDPALPSSVAVGPFERRVDLTAGGAGCILQSALHKLACASPYACRFPQELLLLPVCVCVCAVSLCTHSLPCVHTQDPQEQQTLVAGLHKLKTDLFMQLVETGAMPLRPGVKRLVQEAIAAGVLFSVCVWGGGARGCSVGWIANRPSTADQNAAGHLLKGCYEAQRDSPCGPFIT